MRYLLSFLVLALTCCTLSYAQSISVTLGGNSPSKIALETNEIDSDDNNSEEKEESVSGSPSAFGTIISSVFGLPMRLFRALTSLMSSSPLSRLREEMQNLNISYPKK